MLTKGQQELIVRMWKKTRPIILEMQKQNPKIQFEPSLIPGFTVSVIRKKFRVYPGEGNRKIYPAIKTLVRHGLIASRKTSTWEDTKQSLSKAGIKINKHSQKNFKRIYTQRTGKWKIYCLTYPGLVLGECLLKAEKSLLKAERRKA